MRERRRTTDAVEILHRRYVGEDPERKAALETARVHAEVARTIYELRTEAGLTQHELAKAVGTTQSVISRLEDEDYEGHSLAMLNRIARALNQRVSVLMTDGDPETGTLRYALQLALQNLRKARKLTIDELAKQTGIDRGELVAAERNASYKPTPATLHKLSQFFGVPEKMLAALAGAFVNVPEHIADHAKRYAAQSESFDKLTPEEKKALDQFVEALRSESSDAAQ